MLTLILGMTFASTMTGPASLVKAQPSAQLKIMPLGDSITEGYNGTTGNLGVDGYRTPLYLDLVNNGFSVDFVGSQNNGTGLDNDNEGHIGYSADEIRDDVNGWLTENPADVVLLHIGTNDIQDGEVAFGIVSEVEGILNNIYQWGVNNNKTVTVILASIILRSDNSTLNSTTISYNSGLQTMASNRIADGDPLIMVDMEHALVYPTDLVSDGIHPTPTGYGKMATIWYNALASLLSYSLTVDCPHGVVTKFPNQTFYPYGTEVTLTVTAAAGWTFNSWSGDLLSSNNPENIIMNSNKTITTTFTQDQYQITMVTNFGSVSPTSGSWYNSGSSVTIYAFSPNVVAGERYVWNGWIGSGNGSYTGAGNNTDLVTMNGPVVETASWNDQYKLVVETNLGTTEPSVGEYWFNAGTPISVEAQPPSAENGVQYVCLGWSGTGSVPTSGNESAVSFLMNAPSNITWTWKTQYYLTVSSVYGYVGGNGWYDAGSSAYATISPTLVYGNGGVQYTFSGWSDDASGSSSSSNAIVMDGPKTATANWSPVPTITPQPTPTPTHRPTVIPTPTPTLHPTASPSLSTSPTPSNNVSTSPSLSPSSTNVPISHDNTLFVEVVVLGVVLTGGTVGIFVLKRRTK